MFYSFQVSCTLPCMFGSNRSYCLVTPSPLCKYYAHFPPPTIRLYTYTAFCNPFLFHLFFFKNHYKK
ncbi:hypothetical protein BCR43DRAFT_298203 [Syncephalastrum racemosum]|uniref:Uncharacterized protein n=1 Tax=Syncephalastrum racemosum TaxID=13706 RepID=A0A1X2H9L1_SYNRA|nr:hypothetical protein BCR43DRAFT_298203 [Syncephalastrum racemosum]